MSIHQKPDLTGNFFLLPNALFLFGLSPGEFTVYSYLRCCEDRETYQCWPSYKTISNAVGLSVHTVQKHVSALVDKGLIRTESTSVTTKAGLKRNGNLLYTILPFQSVLDDHYKQKLEALERDTARDRPRAALCATASNEAGPDPSPTA